MHASQISWVKILYVYISKGLHKIAQVDTGHGHELKNLFLYLKHRYSKYFTYQMIH